MQIQSAVIKIKLGGTGLAYASPGSELTGVDKWGFGDRAGKCGFGAMVGECGLGARAGGHGLGAGGHGLGAGGRGVGGRGRGAGGAGALPSAIVHGVFGAGCGFLAGIDKVLNLAGRLGPGLSFYGIWAHF